LGEAFISSKNTNILTKSNLKSQILINTQQNHNFVENISKLGRYGFR